MNVHTGKVVYWEHAGLMDDAVYANDFVRKMVNNLLQMLGNSVALYITVEYGNLLGFILYQCKSYFILVRVSSYMHLCYNICYKLFKVRRCLMTVAEQKKAAKGVLNIGKISNKIQS